jgi:hypothetical protein
MLDIRKPLGVLALLVVVGATAIAPTLASAKEKKAHKYTSTVQTTALTTDNGYPAPGGTAVITGTISTDAFGSGAVITRVTVTGQPEPNVFAFKGKETDLYAPGTLKNKFTGTASVQSDGSQVIEIQGKYTGGTARYRGASGHFAFSGTVEPGSTVVNGHSSGKVIY